MKKRNLLVTAVSLSLAFVIGIGATLAYYTDQTEVVTNTFVASDGIDIELDEAKVDPETGVAKTPENRVIENDYVNIFPNKLVDKDPTVHVKEVPFNGADVFVRITGVMDTGDYADVDGEGNPMMTLVGMTGWTKVADVDGSAADDSQNGIYKYDSSVTAVPTDLVVFTDIQFGNYATAPEAFSDVTVFAYAIQTDLGTATTTTTAEAIAALKQ